MRAAAIQLNSTADKARNLEAAERLVRAAAADGAELVALPEKWNLLGDSATPARRAPSRSTARRSRAARGLGARARHPPARRQHRRAGRGPGEGLQHLGPDRPRRRARGAVYRKIHMFDVDVGGVAYRESEHEQPGDEIVTAPRRRRSRLLGLTVCYDLRFPELYRILAVRGARVITVPSAFTLDTGTRPLGGAAAGPGDREPGLRPRRQPGRRGAAALPTPTGTRRSSTPGAWCSAQAPDERVLRRRRPRPRRARSAIRASLPSLANRRPEAYAWPQLTEAHA